MTQQTASAVTKELAGVYSADSQHMVGDGFPVRNMIPGPEGDDQQFSPSCFWTIWGRSIFLRPTGGSAWVSIRIGGLKR